MHLCSSGIHQKHVCFFGYEQISSKVVVQQVDPGGPMSFSLCIQPTIEMRTSELNI